jgi:RNA polymerase sigma factor (sigma-70 family)
MNNSGGNSLAILRMPMPACTETPTRTHAECEQMLRDAENSIVGHLRKQRVPESKFDDLAQECRVAVWHAATKFDPARGTQWKTYAVAVVKNVMRREADRLGGECSPGRAISLNEMEYDAADDRDEYAGPDEFDELKRAIRLQLGEPMLAKLTPKMRRIVEMVAFEGRSPAQVADELGQPVKVVKVNLQAAIRTMLGEVNPVHAILAANADRIRRIRELYPKATLKQLHERLDLPNIAPGQLGKALKRIERGEAPEGNQFAAKQRRQREALALRDLIDENAGTIRKLFPGDPASIRRTLKDEFGLELTAKQVEAMAARIDRGEPLAGTVEDYLPAKPPR